MIDPRALQQHFRKVQQQQIPQKQTVPRIPDLTPLTAVQAIPILEPIQPTIDTSKLQEELLGVTQALTTLKQTLSPNPVIDTTTAIAPLSVNPVVHEVYEVAKIETNTEKTDDTNTVKNDYDPYGYYSGPLF